MLYRHINISVFYGTLVNYLTKNKRLISSGKSQNEHLLSAEDDKMGCTASTAIPSNIWPKLSKWKQIDNKSDTAIEYKEECKDCDEDAFAIQDSDAKVPIISNNTDATMVEMKINLLESGELFVDDDFPPENRMLYYTSPPTDERITWMRPHEIVEVPMMQIDGVNRNDIVQGILGDCWFLSSCAAVSQRPDMMSRVIPNGQVLTGIGYSGAVRFNFWRFGKWMTVYVDDYLPTVNGNLIYARSSDKREFWVSLIEKAYAKLHGSYESLGGGQSMDALVDLTSGLAERYDLAEYQTDNRTLYKILYSGGLSGAFMTCSRQGDWKTANKPDGNGLVSGHAYTVTSVKTVKRRTQRDRERLLRIRNPWADGTEWNRSWSDNDSVWDEVEESSKNQIQYKNEDEGEFWMCMDDFCKEFEEITICTLGPDYEGDGIADYSGKVSAIKGSWTAGKSSGGSRNDLQKFATNPQYLLVLKEPDENDSLDDDDEEEERAETCSIIVALMQENMRSQRHLGVSMWQIGFVIYRVSKTKRRMSSDYFLYHHDSGTSGPYINYREVIGRFELSPGIYIIIPATFEPKQEARFMIRVYADKPYLLREIK
ncbi:Uncharacterised protein g10003 [Pycnogonum litorale]